MVSPEPSQDTRLLAPTVSLTTVWPWTSLWISVSLSTKCLQKIRDEIKGQFNLSFTLERQPKVVLDKITPEELPTVEHYYQALSLPSQCAAHSHTRNAHIHTETHTATKDSLLLSVTCLKHFTETLSCRKIRKLRMNARSIQTKTVMLALAHYFHRKKIKTLKSSIKRACHTTQIQATLKSY